jgi:hypothetical protein
MLGDERPGVVFALDELGVQDRGHGGIVAFHPARAAFRRTGVALAGVTP